MPFNSYIHHPFMSCSIQAHVAMLRPDVTSPTPFWTWEDTMRVTAMTTTTTWHRELCYIELCIVSWFLDNDVELYIVLLSVCFGVLFWRLLIRRGNQNRLYYIYIYTDAIHHLIDDHPLKNSWLKYQPFFILISHFKLSIYFTLEWLTNITK
jgi:hypothetical protein